MPQFDSQLNFHSPTRFVGPNQTLCYLLSLLLLTVSSIGCNTLNPERGDIAEVTAAPQQQIPTYKILVYGKGEPQSIIGKLDANKTVQDAVDEARVARKFARMEIVLARENQSVHGREKLKVAYDSKKRRVVVSEDYALRENDIVVIKRDSSNSLEQVVQKLSGTLSR